MAYTDVLNETLDDLAAALAAITGVNVFTDPRNINPPCIFLDAPTFEAFNYNVVKMTFPCVILSLGPSNLDALRNMLAIASKMVNQKVGVTGGQPTVTTIGSVEYPSYSLNINIQGQTA
jgi:hypothetical protein